MSKKEQNEFKQLAEQATRVAMILASKKEARGMPPPPAEKAMYHTVVAFRCLAQALSETFNSTPGRMSAPQR